MRRRVLRSVFLLLVIGILSFAGAVKLRNRARLTEATDRFQAQIADLQQTHKSTGTLPVFYPSADLSEPLPDTTGFTYAEPAVIRYARTSSGPVIVAYSSDVRQILKPERQVVAILDGGSIRIGTLTTGELRRRLQAQRRAAEQAAKQSG